MPLAHGGTVGLVAEILLALAAAAGLGLVWAKERRRTRASGRREAPMRDDAD
jgi:hypothetical protein